MKNASLLLSIVLVQFLVCRLCFKRTLYKLCKEGIEGYDDEEDIEIEFKDVYNSFLPDMMMWNNISFNCSHNYHLPEADTGWDAELNLTGEEMN